MPGVFDPHVHIGIERSFEEEAETETRAALIGGVTTIGIFLRSASKSYLDDLPGFRSAMDERSYVDSIFHPQIFTREQIAEIPLYAENYGIRSFKFYMSGLPGVVDSITDDLLLEGFRTVAALGPDAVTCVHCENGALVDQARASLKQRRSGGTLADWAEAHPPEAEALAIQTAAFLARLAGAHLYVVHLSSLDGMAAVKAARQAGTRLTVETTTPYLGLTSDDSNGFLIKMVPPIRAKAHGDALWFGVADATIDTVGTDNTSRSLSTKRPEAGLHGSKPGLPALGTHLPVLLHYGRLRGIPLEVLVDCATRAPATVYGIYPQKGTIAIGSDADLVLVDPDLERVVNATDLNGMSDFSPFQGKTLRGWPVMTIKGGTIAVRDGRLVAPSAGRYLPRPARGNAACGRLTPDSALTP
ncbi:dihydroorotase family protein [Beijerinckia sp. L45]|uniref:dihydroorotase n=1 Tax=Beijerinckia sp. L45 TaxID=1641855 RepID=UPI00131C5894|nr:amidohydrolase family protein [Beijerinckia sp. L45]